MARYQKDERFYSRQTLEILLEYHNFLRGEFTLVILYKDTYKEENIKNVSHLVANEIYSHELEEQQCIICRIVYQHSLDKDSRVQKNTISESITLLKECNYPCEALVVAGFDRYELSRHYTNDEIRDAERKFNLEPADLRSFNCAIS